MKKNIYALLFAGLLSMAGPAAADLTVAQVGPLSGPLAMTGKDYQAGARIYFDSINARGGINGQKIRFITEDDGYKPEETVRLIQETIKKSHPIAFIGTVGTANIEALMKDGVLDQAETPLVGIRTGAKSVLGQPIPYIFSTRASYAEEINEIVRQLWVKRVAVFYQDDGFGQDGLTAAIAALKQRNLELVAKGAYERNTTHVEAAVQAIAPAKPDAIIMVSNTAATAEFVKQIRAREIAPVLAVVSVTDGPQVAKLIGNNLAHGLTVAQVVPNPKSTSSPLGRDLSVAFTQFPPPKGTELSYTVGEGYVAAKVLVEALRRAGPAPTSKKVRDALESIRNFSEPGVNISFSTNNHGGSRFVEMSIMDASGNLRSQ